MEIIIIIWIVLIFGLNIVKKNAGAKSQNSRYGSAGSREMADKVSSWTRKVQDNMNGKAFQNGKTSQSRYTKTVSSGRKQESWRNTAEVTRSDITFRGLREGEDELAFLIRKNTAYEKLLEARLVSRGE